MKCTNCNTENNSGANFCKKCGLNLNKTNLTNKKDLESSSDNLLITYLCIAFITFISIRMINTFVDYRYGDSISKYVKSSIYIISNFSTILIPLAIKNKSLKIIGLILAIIVILYFTYINVEIMIE